VKSATCTRPITGSATFTLDEAVLRAWYTESSVYAYRVRNLRLEDPYDVSPCASGTSRWRRTSGLCSSATSGIQSATLATLERALSSSTDPNPFVTDITLTGNEPCTDVGRETVGAKIQVGADCFEHVHPNEEDVRDFSLWAITHDGNSVARENNR
jgi:hypothetical protein